MHRKYWKCHVSKGIRIFYEIRHDDLFIEICIFQFFQCLRVLKFQSGEFVVPEPGLYLFLVTCCTYDMKKCLLSIRKNGKDVANIHDQDGDTNKVVQDF